MMSSMWELRARLSFVNLDLEQRSARHFSRSCHSNLESENPFAAVPSRSDVVRFVSILSKPGGIRASLPVTFPSDGAWLVRVLACDGQFVFGMYRRHMKTIGYLGQIDKLYGVPATTRNWNTIMAIVRVLKRPAVKGR